MLEEKGVKARYVQVAVIERFPDGLSRHFKGETILIENNRSSQLGTLIKLNTGYSFENVALRYDGRPFTPHEILDKALEVA